MIRTYINCLDYIEQYYGDKLVRVCYQKINGVLLPIGVCTTLCKNKKCPCGFPL